MFLAVVILMFIFASIAAPIIGHTCGIVKFIKDRKTETKQQNEILIKKYAHTEPPQAEQDKDYFLEQEQAALHKLIKTLDNQFEEAKTERERVQILSKQATALRRLNTVTAQQYKLWKGWDNF